MLCEICKIFVKSLKSSWISKSRDFEILYAKNYSVGPSAICSRKFEACSITKFDVLNQNYTWVVVACICLYGSNMAQLDSYMTNQEKKRYYSLKYIIYI